MLMKDMLLSICEEENISCLFLSKDWICVLERGDVKKVIAGYKFFLNDHALGTVLDDKYALYEFLSLGNIPVIKHHLFYGEHVLESYAEGCNSFSELKKIFHFYHEDVVLKVNDGTCGRDVYHIQNEADLERLYSTMTKKHHSISLCPYYEIENEYRVIVLNGKVEMLYKKERPIVYGDGKSTIRDLLCAFHPTFFSNIKDTLDNRVLALGEEYVYNWKFNLSLGARMSLDISPFVQEKVTSLALLASSYVGMNFGSVDIIKVGDFYYILEMNSGVMMKNMALFNKEMKEKAKEIYRKAILTYFAKKSSEI